MGMYPSKINISIYCRKFCSVNRNLSPFGEFIPHRREGEGGGLMIINGKSFLIVELLHKHLPSSSFSPD
jgi:hypothetical protein